MDVHVYDADYFERGQELGISGYTNYSWQPERSRGEVAAFIRTLHIPTGSRCVDFGCAKGFFVRAMLESWLDGYGIDVSDYARENCDPAVRGRLFSLKEYGGEYEYGFIKDTLEHVPHALMDQVILLLSKICPRWMMIVPLGDYRLDGAILDNFYRIPEYECDVTHIVRANETWWLDAVRRHFRLLMVAHWVSGCKDKWFQKCPTGNLVIVTDGPC